jgi:hypothetical protein
MPLANIDNSEWTRHQWVDMFLKKVTNEIREKRVRNENKKRLATNDRTECPVKQAKVYPLYWRTQPLW